MYRPYRPMMGFTLIEIQIAMVLALFISLGMSQLYIAHGHAGRLANNINRVSEQGRMATVILRDYIGLSGMQDVTAGAPVATVNPTVSGVSGGTPLARNALDSITINYVPTNTVVANQAPPQCDGIDHLRADMTGVLSIATGASGNPGLFCTALAGINQELVSNIEHLRIYYGEYLSGTAPNEVLVFVEAEDVTNVNNVYAVRIAFISRSPEEIHIQDTAWSESLLGAIVTKNDRYLRKVYTITIPLKNNHSL